MTYNEGLEAAARWHDCQAAALKPGRSHSLRKIRRFHEIAAQEIRSRVVSPVPNEPVVPCVCASVCRAVNLLAQIENLRAINANLMGDDEDKPRYTTKRLKQEIARATEPYVVALVWYAEKVAGCRKIGREGDEIRAELDRDGGENARTALGWTE